MMYDTKSFQFVFGIKKTNSELHQDHLDRPSIQERTFLDKTHLEVVKELNLTKSFQLVRQQKELVGATQALSS